MKDMLIKYYIDKVKKSPKCIKKIPEQVLRENPEICLEAIVKDKKVIKFIPKDVIQEHESIQSIILISENISNIFNISDEILNSNPQLHKLIIKETKGDYIPREFLLNNVDFAEECISELSLNTSAIVDLIVYTKNIEYIKEKIKDRKEYNFSIFDVNRLVRALESNDEIEKVINEDKQFTTFEIVSFILDTKDVEFIKKSIKNRRKYGFTPMDLRKLIINTHDTEYIKMIIKNREDYGLVANDIKEILLKIEDKKFVKEILRNLLTYEKIRF